MKLKWNFEVKEGVGIEKKLEIRKKMQV